MAELFSNHATTLDGSMAMASGALSQLDFSFAKGLQESSPLI
jgi:hypothetical protein